MYERRGHSFVLLRKMFAVILTRPGILTSPHPPSPLIRLPECFRSNLTSCFVLHCDLTLWAASMAFVPWLTGGLWRKIDWISRVEFLWDHLEKVS